MKNTIIASILGTVFVCLCFGFFLVMSPRYDTLGKVTPFVLIGSGIWVAICFGVYFIKKNKKN